MRTLQQLIDNTPDDVKIRAEHVRVFNLTVSHLERKLLKSMVFKGKAHARTETIFYDVYMELYPKTLQMRDMFKDIDKRTDLSPLEKREMMRQTPVAFQKPRIELPVFVKCSCPFFLFNCEVALARVGCSEVDFSNGKRPRVTNPRMVPYLCKHLYASYRPIIDLMRRAAEKDKRYEFTED